MNRQSLRAFSFGILFATIILTIFYYQRSETKSNPEKVAKEYIQTNNLKVLSSKEYDEYKHLKEKVVQLKKETEAPSNEKVKTEQKEITYTLTIRRGMTSGQVASLLESAHIVTNAKSFKNYLADRNMTYKIQIGQYHLNNQMSFPEIAGLITK